MVTACKHPRVRIVSRHEDTEYVECLECGDVFDSEEFHDMAIEESAEKKEEVEDEGDDFAPACGGPLTCLNQKSIAQRTWDLDETHFNSVRAHRSVRCCG